MHASHPTARAASVKYSNIPVFKVAYSGSVVSEFKSMASGVFCDEPVMSIASLGVGKCCVWTDVNNFQKA